MVGGIDIQHVEQRYSWSRKAGDYFILMGIPTVRVSRPTDRQ